MTLLWPTLYYSGKDTLKTCLNNAKFDSNCDGWKNKGYCTTTVTNILHMMQKYCKESCGFCGGEAGI